MRMWNSTRPLIDGMFLRSRVGRRMFLAFVMSAMVPAIMLALLTYGHVRTMDREYIQRQLAHEGGSYARALYERLLGVGFSLGVQAASVREGLRLDAEAGASIQYATRNGYRRLYRIRDDQVSLIAGPNAPLAPPSIAAELRPHLERGESVLQTLSDGGKARILLISMVDPARPKEGMLVAEIEPSYLWNDEDEFTAQLAICVLDGDRRQLFCSDDKQADKAMNVRQRKGTIDGWEYEVRELFLRAKFAHPDWSIVAMRPPGPGESGWVQLAYIFLGVILFTVLLVSYLSVSQIRRTLIPLERLIDGTQRIEREEYDQPVKVRRDDEFGQLAQSFNSMAGRIGRQIGTLKALSEIDQEILARVEMSRIIGRVQERLEQIWPRSVTSMVVFDQQEADFGIVHLHSGSDEMTAKLPTRLEPWLLERVARAYDGMWFDVSGAELPDFLNLLVQAGAKRVLVLPIHWQDKVNGLLAIGLLALDDFSEEQVRQARDLGNRIGVALAAHARDEELKYRAFHDNLTSLPNRALLVERMNQEIAHARRNGKQLALLFMDLDRFKNVNDSLGHDSGDLLLCQVADRLNACTREGDTVARLGGDEFVVLLPGLSKAEQAGRLALEMMKLLSEPYQLDGGEYYVGVSIGAAIFPADGSLAHELLKKADMAMYRAKAMGRGQLIFFEEGMNIVQQERVRMERELRQALARGQLQVHYHPRYQLADGKLVGAEALMRWSHPELGWIPPAKFIPLAEEIGLIEELGLWVVRQVCEQLVLWHKAGQEIDISINVSVLQLKSGQFVRQLQEVLTSTGVRPRSIELEITEGIQSEDIESIRAQLAQIRQAGVQIAMDDFGVGYSTLTYLQRFPLDILKIDRSFVREIGLNSSDGSIVHSIIALAHAMGKLAVAEGVESEQQLSLLRNWGCDQAQGNYFSRPLNAQALTEMMAAVRPAALKG